MCVVCACVVCVYVCCVCMCCVCVCISTPLRTRLRACAFCMPLPGPFALLLGAQAEGEVQRAPGMELFQADLRERMRTCLQQVEVAAATAGVSALTWKHTRLIRGPCSDAGCCSSDLNLLQPQALPCSELAVAPLHVCRTSHVNIASDDHCNKFAVVPLHVR